MPSPFPRGLGLSSTVDGPDTLTRSGAWPAGSPMQSCNSSCEVGEVGLRVLGPGPRSLPGRAEGSCRGQAETGAQISMSVILKPSTMLSMLRMKVSSFE